MKGRGDSAGDADARLDRRVPLDTVLDRDVRVAGDHGKADVRSAG
jgi:hypothetical protein